MIAVDDRLKCEKIEIQIYLKSKMKYTWNCQEIVKTSMLMNKIAFQIELCEFASLSTYAEKISTYAKIKINK